MPALLAIDSSTERMLVAVSSRGRSVCRDQPGGAQASARLLPLIAAALSEAGLAIGDLDAIAFGKGPGAFTGLRTAASVVQGLAFGAGKPVLAIDSLMIQAEAAAGSPGTAGSRTCWVAVDARMDEIYAGEYLRIEPPSGPARWRTLREPALYAVADLAACWRERPPAKVAGNAVAVFGGRLGVDLAIAIEGGDPAAALLRLALQAWAAGGALPAEQAQPVYLRDKVALTSAERASRTAAAPAAPAAAGKPAAARPADRVVRDSPATDHGARPDPGTAARVLRLVPMRTEDLVAVMAVERSAYAVPWTQGNFVDSLAAGYRAWLARDDDGNLIGYYVALIGAGDMHLLNLTIAPAHAGRGHGRALLERVVGEGRESAVTTLWLEVRVDNEPARRLYRDHGFTEVGRRRGYYPKPGGGREDAIVMKLDLEWD